MDEGGPRGPKELHKQIHSIEVEQFVTKNHPTSKTKTYR